VNEIAFRVVREATRDKGKDLEPSATSPKRRKKNPAAVALGRLGGRKGGPARAEKLSKARRMEIARTAAQARWERERTPEVEE